ncbi:MAG: NFACT family protein, partial [Oscillospiraceae bacterium]
LVLSMRGKGFNEKLLICVKNSGARIHFAKNSYENPMQPPMFCMLMRKHLCGAKLTGVSGVGFERVVLLNFDGVNEMGDRVNLTLAVELIGIQSNIILIDGNGRIIDALKRSDMESGGRLIQPGARYEMPLRQEKMNIEKISVDDIMNNIFSKKDYLDKCIMNTVDGISPLIARELSFIATGNCRCDCESATVGEREILKRELLKIKDNLNQSTSYIMYKKDNEPLEFSYMPIKQYGESTRAEEHFSFCELLDSFYENSDKKDKMRVVSTDTYKLMSNVESRAARKILARKEDLKKCEGREKLRIYGELIKANLHCIPKGVSSIEVQNYYDSELGLIKIPMNSAISATANAARYFKEYKKSYTAEQMLQTLISDGESELRYAQSVLQNLDRAENVAELNEIRTELIEAGYLKSGRGDIKKKQKSLLPREFVSEKGFMIYVGRNNKQNDTLTLKTAAKNDIWLHVKDYPGSHVIIICGGEVPDEDTLFYAANLAAFYSKVGNSSSVAVDYAPVKYVKKPSGAKPGMVIYTDNKTIIANPLAISH